MVSIEDKTQNGETPITLLVQYGWGHILKEFIGENTEYSKKLFNMQGDDSNKKKMKM